ncbi:phage tail protein [Clostridium sulfidigenes]|uniref:phage tail protein n=1 Tax=Clostridium sulfidigenes TaxID=318464 RepID=UPI003F8A8B8E
MRKISDGRIIIDTQIDSKGAEKGVKGLGGKLGSLAKTGAVAITGLATAASGVVAALTTLSIKQYAEYEQLTGGVETLFKKNSDQVIKYANNAYKTAGMSANEYMSTITGFSASLLQGLGGDTKKAAEIGNMAVIDMSDNANKMGTAIERIQDAYQGFAKQNYTMLDNLKLGYGGTKTEMERLLADAQKISGVKYNISNFNDVIEAIHVIQEQMGITGTTSLEAASTIEGSLNMTKSAWTNLLTGMADDNANFDVLVQNLVESLGALGENLLPRIKIAIEGIGELFRTLLPKVLDEVPEMIASLFPESMQEDVRTIFEGIVEAIKNTVNVALQWLPKITEGFAWILDNGNTIATVIVGIGTALLVLNVANMIMGVVKAFKGVKTATEAWAVAQKLLNIEMMANPIGLIIAAIAGLVAAFIYLWNTNEGFRNFFINAWNMIKDGFIAGWNGMIAFFTETIPSWIESIRAWFGSLGEWFGTLWTNIKQFFIDGWNAIASFFTETIPSWIQQMFDWFNELPYKIGYAMGFVLQKIIQWGKDTWNYLVTNVPIWINSIVNWFAKLPGRIWTWLLNTINKIIQWGQQTYSNMVSAVTSAINAVIQWFTTLPGKIWQWLLNTISKVVQFGKNLGNEAQKAGSNMVKNIIGAVKDLPSKFLDIGVNIVKGIWNGITSMGSWIHDKVTGFFKGMLDGAKEANDIHSPSRLYRDKIGAMMAQGVGVGFESETSRVEKDIRKNLADIVSNINIDEVSAKLNAAVYQEQARTSRAITAGFNKVVNNTNTITNDNGVTQNVTIVNPERTPAENARALKKVGRDLAFGY